MKPIHPSKLKEGDLVYVEFKYTHPDALYPTAFLVEILVSNKVGVSGKNGNTGFCDFYKSYNYFLIERGYFL